MFTEDVSRRSFLKISSLFAAFLPATKVLATSPVVDPPIEEEYYEDVEDLPDMIEDEPPFQTSEIFSARVDQLILPEMQAYGLHLDEAMLESMRTRGCLNPILIFADNRVIDGCYRVRAARHLGWTTIPARRMTLA